MNILAEKIAIVEQRIRDIKSDIADFDGDRRGMYEALDNAEVELTRLKAMTGAKHG